MKKNLYYRHHFRRSNLFKEFIYGFALGMCSSPRLLLEVFIRKNFGERYFSLYSAIRIFCSLLIIPFIFFLLHYLYEYFIGAAFGGIGRNSYSGMAGSAYESMQEGGYARPERGVDWGSFFGNYTTWYIFSGLFLYVSYRRNEEIKRNPSVFDFAKFSLYTGDVDPRFMIVKDSDGQPDWRKIETLVEPAFFFAIGVIFWLIGQPLGILLVLCSIAYSLSYAATYHHCDHFIMDMIDEIICNKNLEQVFFNDVAPEEANYLRGYGRKPADKDLRRELVSSFIVEEAVKVE